MRNIYLGTAITENYIEKAMEYLHYISLVSSVKKFCLLVDFDNEDLREEFPYIEFISIKKPSGLTEKCCLQHGEFIEYLPCGINDIVIFTDTDGYFQRDLSQRELLYFSNLNHIEFAVATQFDATGSCKLSDEAYRLDIQVSLAQISQKLNFIPSEMRCFNTGFVGATTASWYCLRDKYRELWDCVDGLFKHYAKQQFLISYIIQSSYNYSELPASIHVHGHHGVPKGAFYRGDKAYLNGQLVFFSHNLDHLKQKMIMEPIHDNI